MTQDVEILYGDPEKAGSQGTLYFGVGDKCDRAAMTEIKPGGYVFIPKGSTMFG